MKKEARSRQAVSSIFAPTVDPNVRSKTSPLPDKARNSFPPSMEAEKAAVKRILAQEAGFRQEKQDVVASLGGSPAELVTPSANNRLQRMLNHGIVVVGITASDKPGFKEPTNGDDTPQAIETSNSSELVTPSADTRFQRNRHHVIAAVCITVSDGSVFEEPANRDDTPQDIDHIEGQQQYSGTESTSDIKSYHKYRYWIVGVLLLVAVIGGIIGAVVALTGGADVALTGGAPYMQNEQGEDSCTLDRATLCVVPECAQEKYDVLQDTFLPSNNEPCNVAQLAVTALAVASTANDIDDPGLFFALSTLYLSMEGERWTNDDNWLEDPLVCTWYGVNCTEEGIELDLQRNNLRGSIPTEIGLLISMRDINLAKSPFLRGSLPTQIGLLTGLKGLDLDASWLVGQIPSEIGNCANLIKLNMQLTDFTGTVPSEIGNLASLGTNPFCHPISCYTVNLIFPFCRIFSFVRSLFD